MRKIIIFFLFVFSFSYNFQNFKHTFVINGTHTVDPYNNNRVTSESQGYTLLLAVLYNDKTLFDNVWQWTKENLQRKDFLFSWEWNGKVLDKNNATDGDLLIAYSLLKAYKKWGDERYLYEYKKIIKSLKKMFVITQWNGQKYYLLAPGKYGFIKNNYIMLYPSYYIPFIFKSFFYSTYDPIWLKAYNFSYRIYNLRLSTHIYYDFINKIFYPGKCKDLDLYRIIPYTLMDKGNLDVLRINFSDINNFFERKHYIPLKYYSSDNVSGKSPYCVYYWFYLLYGNKSYLKRYYQLQKIDKKNYFCEAIDLIVKKTGGEK